MIVSNPVNIQPFIDEMRNDLNRSLELMNSEHVETVNSLLTGLDNALEGITAINGEISTEVSAINQFTAQRLDEMKGDVIQSLGGVAEAASSETAMRINNLIGLIGQISVVKQVHKVYTNQSSVTIPAVNMAKTLVVLNTSIGISQAVQASVAIGAYLSNSTTLTIKKFHSTAGNEGFVAVEVVEYA